MKKLRYQIALAAVGLSFLLPGLRAQVGVPAEPHLKLVKAVFEPAKVAPGGTVTLRLHVSIDKGWHIYGSAETSSQPTTLSFRKADGLTPTGDARVPPGEEHSAYGVTNYWLKGAQVFTQRVKVAKEAKGKLVLQGQIDFMQCTPEMCDPPSSLPFEATLNVVASAHPAPSTPADTSPADTVAAAPGQESQDPGLDPFGALPGMEKVTATGSVTPATARPGEIVLLKARVSVLPGYHVYGAKQEAGATTMTVVEKGTLEPIGRAILPDGELHEGVYSLEDEFEIVQSVQVPKDAKPGTQELKASIDYTVCDATSCDPPATLAIAASLKIEEGEVRQEYSKAIASQGGNSGTALGEDEKTGLWLFLLSAIGWGLFALLMPCTYPMIPITISFFTKQADARGGKVLPLSLTYGTGIVLIFILIGLVVGGPIIAFATHWITNLVIGAVFLLFALSLFGMITLQPPRFLLDYSAKASMKGGYLGVFLMGATLVVTSFTCTAPFVGALLMTGASAGDYGRIALGMGVFGLTMAIPFVFLSLVPGKIASLPKSGEWMNTLKAFLGFIEFAAALKFLSNADMFVRSAYADDYTGLLSRELFLVLWFGIFLVAGLFLLGLIRLKDDAKDGIGPGRMVAGLCTILFGFYCAFGALGHRMDMIMTAIIPNYSSGMVEGMSAATGKAGEGEKKSGHTYLVDDYDAARKLALEEKKLLLINFTGVT